MTAAAVRTFAEGVDHVEGLAISDAGVVWCGGEDGQVYNVTLDGAFTEVARLPGEVLGVALDARERAYCAVLGEHAGLYRAQRDGTTELLSAGTPERPVVTPNHPLLLADGTILFTDSGTWGADDGCLFAIDAGGVTRVADESCRHFPNGLAQHPETGAVVVVESTLPGVTALDLGADGRLTGRRVLCTLDGTVPDGVTFDARARLLVSCWTPDTILLVDGDAVSPLATDPFRQVLISPANTAFVPGTTTVITTNAGNRFLSAFEHDAPGAPLVRPEVTA